MHNSQKWLRVLGGCSVRNGIIFPVYKDTRYGHSDLYVFM